MARARPAKAAPSTVTAGMTVAEGFRSIAAACIAHLKANEAALTQKRDPEALHQSRVAIRRLRACLSIFDPVLRRRPVVTARRRLKQAFETFGHCRDLDVFLANRTETDVTPPADLTAARNAAYDGATELVRADDYQWMIADMAAAIDEDRWLKRGRKGSALQAAPLIGFARGRLDECLALVARRGRKFDRLDPAARHRLRIAVKKLRYAVDFFAVLFGGKTRRKPCKQFLAATEELQERLGALNDLAVGVALERRMDAACATACTTRKGRKKAAERAERTFVAAQTAAAARALDVLRTPAPFWSI
jgi:CHAD domain-containing protein